MICPAATRRPVLMSAAEARQLMAPAWDGRPDAAIEADLVGLEQLARLIVEHGTGAGGVALPDAAGAGNL